ncbi:MAG: FMN-binding protein [Candidatus Omnitrophota bacterium]|jgi:electron transport complex protein RnfG|nr:FMN-binding protein [Candidatus Omnitrophota bacterium]MDD5519002.1 FMN-binding protein [Candidatus Omnitrophota bacterium]
MVRFKIICFIMAGLLLGLAQIEAGEELNFKEVLPQAVQFMPVKKGAEVLYYKAQDQDGKLIGAVFKAKGKSYSDIETLVGMLNDGTITAIKVLSQNETPGVGSRITGPQFTGQFRNIKDISKVQAITGATVSSQVVIDAVRKKAKEIKELLKNEA